MLSWARCGTRLYRFLNFAAFLTFITWGIICLQSWSQIQLLLRKGDDTLIEMARLEKFLEIEQFPSVDDETLEKVQEIVNTHSEEDVRRIDNTAASFYQWVKYTTTQVPIQQ